MRNPSCEVHLTVKVPSEVGRAQFEESAKRVQKVVKMRGFRQGKVPINIVRNRFRDKVIANMLAHFVPNLIMEEVKKRNISPIDAPIIEDTKVNDDLSMEIKFLVYVWPKIKLANYKKLRVKKKEVSVKDEDVEKILEEYRRRLLPKEKREDPNLTPRDLPELTDEIVKEWGYESVEKMKEAIKKRLEESRRQEVEEDVYRQIKEFLLKHSSLDVPHLWVVREVKRKSQIFSSFLFNMGMDSKQVEQILNQRKDHILKAAEDDVKLFFIIEEIARKEGIEASEEEIQVKLEKRAKELKLEKKKVEEYLKLRGEWDDFCLDADHEKVWRYLVSICTEGKK